MFLNKSITYLLTYLLYIVTKVGIIVPVEMNVNINFVLEKFDNIPSIGMPF